MNFKVFKVNQNLKIRWLIFNEFLLELRPLLSRNMYVNRTTKDPQMTDLRLFSSVMSPNLRCGLQFYTYTAVPQASAQRYIWSPWSCIIALAAETIVRFFLSTTPFCCGLQGTVNSLLIPALPQKSTKPPEMYSPPLSEWSTLILLSVWFSTSALNSLNLSNTSSDSLVFKK